MMKRNCFMLALILAVAGTASAQFQTPLTTTFSSNNGQAGNMFDLVAINDVTICGLDINVDPTGPWNVEVYAVTGGGSYVGNETNPAAWTLLGTANGVTSTGTDSPTAVPLTLGVTIPQGMTQGFYVTLNNGTGINYTNGTTVGSVFAQDANIQFLEGVGKSYPFGSTFTPRIWNGTIYYETGQATGCQLPRPPTEFQVNQSGSSLTIDGASDPGPFVPITVASVVNTQHSLDFASTNSGQPWDLLVAPGSTQGFSSLGIATAGGQTINVDPGASGAFFLNGGFGATFPSSPFSIPFAFPVPTVISAQMAVFDSTHPDGFVVSHAVEYSAEVCNPQQNFDNLPTGTGNAPPGWVNPSSGTAWTVDTGGTPSTGTGPTAANSAPNYMYCETSGSGGSANFVMDTCDIDLTALSSFTLNFALSRIGGTIGTLNVWQDDDGAGTFGTLLMTYTGADPSQSQGGTEWSAESIPFVPGGTSSVAFRFDYTGGGSFTGDIAIDDYDVQ